MVLDSKTYIEGTVLDEEGRAAAGAIVRANQGPQFAMGWVSGIWAETKADNSGKYRLYVQPDEYELAVRTPAQGVMQLAGHAVGRGERHELNLKLDPGISFRATVVDAQSGQPVPNIRLSVRRTSRILKGARRLTA